MPRAGLTLGMGGWAAAVGTALALVLNHNHNHCYTVQGVMKSSLRRGARVSRESLLGNSGVLSPRRSTGVSRQREREGAISRGKQTLPEAGKQAGERHDSDFRREILKNASSSSFWGCLFAFFTTPKLCYKNDWECYVKKYTHMIITFYIHMEVYPLYWRWKLFHFQQKL